MPIPTPSHGTRTSPEIPSTFVQRREPHLSAETEAFPRHLWALLDFSGGLGRRRFHHAPVGAALRARVVARAFHGGHVSTVPHAGPTQLAQVVQAAGNAGQKPELVQQAPGLRREHGVGAVGALERAQVRGGGCGAGPASYPRDPWSLRRSLQPLKTTTEHSHGASPAGVGKWGVVRLPSTGLG